MPQAIDITLSVTGEGQFADKGRSRWLREIIKLYAGRDVRIRVSSPKRSTSANAYLWGVVYARIQQGLLESGTAVSTEAIHEHFKRRYLPARVITVFGEDHVLPGSTSDLDSTAFYEYVEAVRNDEDVLQLGVYIEEPDPVYKSYRIEEMA